MTDQTVALLIDKAISWELVARDLYLSLAEAFLPHPYVAEVWQRMASDESYHASVLQETRDTLSVSRLAQRLNDDEIAMIESVDEELERASRIELRTLDDAYELAHTLESSEVNSVFRIIASLHQRDAETTDLLNMQLNTHIERLTRLSDRFNRDERKCVSIEPLSD